MIDALLIYPKLGAMDSMLMDLPLSVIYAAADSIKQGYNVKLVDLRLEEDWEKRLKPYFDERVLLAGISVMTGSPLGNARQISNFIRKNYTETKIVWGGPHPTVLPETLNESYIDYLVRGYGSVPLSELISYLKGKSGDVSAILGISYKRDGRVFHNPRSREFERVHYLDIPYHLIDINSPKYVRSYSGYKMFPIFTSIGCPYRCSFCVSPTVYKEINGPKWRPFGGDEIIGHMEYVVKNFNARHIVIIDDTSFPDIERMQRVFHKIIGKSLDITLEFRGARINEIDRMDDDFLSLMVRAGGRLLMVGVESGSDRLLKSMQKGTTKEQILRVNRKLARHPQIRVHYNFIYGMPGETYEDLLETKEMVLRLLRENPNIYFGFGGDWKPIPGTRTLEMAEKEYGYKAPRTIDEWIQIDSSDANTKIVHPWYTRRHNNLIKLMQVSSFVVDDKIIKESVGNNSHFFRMLRLMSRIYKPVALFRLKFNIHQLMIEYSLWQLMVKLLRCKRF